MQYICDFSVVNVTGCFVEGLEDSRPCLHYFLDTHGNQNYFIFAHRYNLTSLHLFFYCLILGLHEML